MARLLFFPLLLIIVSVVYVWHFYIKRLALLWKFLYLIPPTAIVTLLIIGLTGHFQMGMIQTFFILMICFAIPVLLFALISSIGRLFGIWIPYSTTAGNTIALFLSGLVLISAIYGLNAGWQRITIREDHLYSKQIASSFDGYRIVQLSDLHVGSYGKSTKFLNRIVDSVKALHPDIIVFTGDMVNSSPDELNPFMKILGRMYAKDGVYSILGNHDYCTYRRYKKQGEDKVNLAKLKKMQHELGWILLLNEHRFIKRGADSIAIIGVENDGRPPFPSYANFPKAIKGIPPTTFQILLSHDPSNWKRKVVGKLNIALTLSGHTHASQLRIGSFSPAQWAYAEWGGNYAIGKQNLIVSTGIGGAFRFRWGAWPEINLIILHKGQ